MKSSAKKIKVTRHSQPNTMNSLMAKRFRTSVDESGFESLLSSTHEKKTKFEEDL